MCVQTKACGADGRRRLADKFWWDRKFERTFQNDMIIAYRLRWPYYWVLVAYGGYTYLFIFLFIFDDYHMTSFSSATCSFALFVILSITKQSNYLSLDTPFLYTVLFKNNLISLSNIFHLGHYVNLFNLTIIILTWHIIYIIKLIYIFI